MMTLRVGLFGAGWAAGAAHGPSLRDYRRRRGGIVLAGVCDIDAARAESVGEAFGFERAYTSVRAMVGSARLDAAIVAVSIPQNASVARACVRAGVPILLEKPPALTQRAAASLARTVRQLRGKVMVAFNRRWAPALLKLRALARKAGRVQSIRCDMRRVRRADADFSTTAVHPIDTVRFLAGDDYGSLAIAYGRCGPRGRATSTHAAGTMAGGAPVVLDIVPMGGLEMERYTLSASGRTLVAELGLGKGPERLSVWSEGTRRDVAVRVASAVRHDTSGFYGEVAALLDAVRRGGKLPGPTVAETVQSVAVMEAFGKGRRRFVGR